MAFRPLQKMLVSSANKIYYNVLELVPRTGIGEMRSVNQCVELPKPETMDLGLMIKAGVPLDQVDCRILDPVGTVNLGSSEPVELEEKKE